MAKLQQIALGILLVLQQLQQRVAKGRAKRFGHIIATALTADQEPLGHQFLDRLTQGGSGNAELLCQRTLGRQPLTGTQGALENHGFQLRDDVVRKTPLPHQTYFHHPFLHWFDQATSLMAQAYSARLC